MALERLGNVNFHTRPIRHEALHQRRQIALQMHPQRQEIRDHYDPADPTLHQAVHGAGKIRLAQFEKRRFHVRKCPGARELGRKCAYSLIRRFYARTVSENNESGNQSRFAL